MNEAVLGRATTIAKAIVLSAGCAVLAAAVVLLAWPKAGTGDLFQFWYAGHLVLTGDSPYDPTAWAAAGAYGDLAQNVVSNCSPTAFEPACLWVYPPATALVFAPFALLDATAGTFALGVSLVALGLASLVALARWMRADAGDLRYVAFAACLVSQPFVFDLHAGHFEGLGVIGLIALGSGLSRRQVLPTAVGALLLSLKPHLYLFVCAVVLVWLIRQRDWRSIGLTIGVLIAVQGGALFRFPDAAAAMLTRSASKTDLGWASTWSFASALIPGAGPVGVALVLAVMVAALVIAVRCAPRKRTVDVLIGCSGAMSLALAPYAHPYDLMVLFPAFALTFAVATMTRSSGRALVLAAAVVLMAVGTWLAIAANQAGAVTSLPGAFAPSVMILLAAASWLARRETSAGDLASEERQGIQQLAHARARRARPANRM